MTQFTGTEGGFRRGEELVVFASGGIPPRQTQNKTWFAMNLAREIMAKGGTIQYTNIE